MWPNYKPIYYQKPSSASNINWKVLTDCNQQLSLIFQRVTKLKVLSSPSVLTCLTRVTNWCMPRTKLRNFSQTSPQTDSSSVKSWVKNIHLKHYTVKKIKPNFFHHFQFVLKIRPPPEKIGFLEPGKGYQNNLTIKLAFAERATLFLFLVANKNSDARISLWFFLLSRRICWTVVHNS